MVAGDENVDTGGVAAPHLEAVEGGQGLLDRCVGGDGGGACAWSGQVAHGPGRAETVAAQRPDGVLEVDHGGVDVFQRPAREPQAAGIQVGLGGRDPALEAADALTHLFGEGVVLQEGAHTGHAPQRLVDGGDPRGRLAEAGGSAGEQPPAGVEIGEEAVGPGNGAGRGAADDGDDPAHG